MACNHCEDADCVQVCPVKAISRRADGIVVVDTSRCIGCQMCGKSCPYAAPQYHTVTGKMQKCTMCFDRVDKGLEPACATVCPTGALQWGKWEEIESKGSPAIEGFTPGQNKPHVRFVTSGWGIR
ncbi:MAG: 4Fe-4S binding protein [Acidobacteria bacterium]|nr:4Fe-4S binding protein [Acidobacteriota bacterium]